MSICIFCGKDHYPQYLCPEKLDLGIDTRDENKRVNALPKVTLDNDFYNVLGDIASRSNMDCWFCLVTYGGFDFVHDLENDKLVSVSEGIKDLIEGMTSYADYDLSASDIKAFESGCDNLGLDYDFEKSLCPHGGDETDCSSCAYYPDFQWDSNLQDCVRPIESRLNHESLMADEYNDEQKLK